MEVILPLPTDLTVSEVIVTESAIAGESFSINYRVENLSASPAIGSWEDAVYLSADETWDINDILVGKVLHKGDVAGGASYTEVLTTATPGVTPGNYNVIIRSDIRNQLPESNEQNNFGVSLTQVSVDAPQLTLDTPVISNY